MAYVLSFFFSCLPLFTRLKRNSTPACELMPKRGMHHTSSSKNNYNYMNTVQTKVFQNAMSTAKVNALIITIIEGLNPRYNTEGFLTTIRSS